MPSRCEAKHPTKAIQCGLPADHAGSHQNGWQNVWQDEPMKAAIESGQFDPAYEIEYVDIGPPPAPLRPCAGKDCDGECSNKDCPVANRLIQNEVTMIAESTEALFRKLSMALGNPALVVSEGETFESALIDFAIKRLNELESKNK